MKKYLPLFLFLLGLAVLAGVYFFVIRGREEVVTEEEGPLVEIVLEQRPIASLTPSDDGHWLTLKVEKIVIDAASMDYELLYTLPDGRTQGVPGTIMLEGQGEIERELLLGSESSGKFRYDEGVEQGTLTLRFRNEKGSLIAKFSTQFHLQSGTRELTSLDNRFSYTLSKTPSETFFLTMEVFGIPYTLTGSLNLGPYGIFAGEEVVFAGEVGLDSGQIYRWDGSSWERLESGASSDIGLFVSTTE
jgi:hypothetical protein